MTSVPRRTPWTVVVGSGLAQTVGHGPLVLSTFGLFLLQITDETGWGRSTVSVAFTVSAISFAVGTPLAGRLLDRYALHAVLVPSWVLYTASVASLSVVPRSLPLFYLPFALAGFFAGGTFLPFSKAVVSWFDDKRGTAIGTMAAIAALGASLTPVLARGLIDAVGWRQAYAWMAVVAALVSLTATTVLVRVRGERSERGRLLPDTAAEGRTAHRALPGLTVREALAGRHLWMIGAVLSLSSLAISGIQVNVVPMMTDEGLPPGQVASLLSVYALASLIGRVVSGVLLDRIPARVVAAVVLLCPAVGLFLLGAPFVSAAAGIALVGLAFGTEIDLLSFLVSRYLGVRRVGTLLGMLHCAILLSTAFGPLLTEFGRRATGDYRALFPCIAAALVLSSLIALCLGPYRYPAVSGFDRAVAQREAAPVAAPTQPTGALSPTESGPSR